uniref:Uncharacterized protein n=1 Tax=Lygus hesperus TaxID=30085 RepID=A0A146MAY6_LYGHE
MCAGAAVEYGTHSHTSTAPSHQRIQGNCTHPFHGTSSSAPCIFCGTAALVALFFFLFPSSMDHLCTPFLYTAPPELHVRTHPQPTDVASTPQHNRRHFNHRRGKIRPSPTPSLLQNKITSPTTVQHRCDPPRADYRALYSTMAL